MAKSHMKITFESRRDWFVSLCAVMCGIWSAIGMVIFISWSLMRNWIVCINFNPLGEGPMEYAFAVFVLGIMIYLSYYITAGEIKDEAKRP